MLMFAECKTMLQLVVSDPAQHWWLVVHMIDKQPVNKPVPAVCTVVAAVLTALKAVVH